MSQFLKYIAATIVSILAIYGTWLLLTHRPVPDFRIPKFVDNAVYTGDSVTIRVEKKKESTDQYDIEYFVPKVSGSISPLVAAKINTFLLDEISQMVGYFKEDHRGVSVDQKDALSVSLAKQFVTKQRYLNVELVEYSYLAGSAHPLTYTHTYVFDIQTGEKVGLQDIFDSNQVYLQNISDLVREKLTAQISLQSLGRGDEVTSTTTEESLKDMLDGIDTEKILEATFFEEGILPREENYKEFNVTEEGIEFVFGQYQVAPYVFGEQRVTLLYSEIETILKDSFKKSI
jgi:hypothetical protein